MGQIGVIAREVNPKTPAVAALRRLGLALPTIHVTKRKPRAGIPRIIAHEASKRLARRIVSAVQVGRHTRREQFRTLPGGLRISAAPLCKSKRYDGHNRSRLHGGKRKAKVRANVRKHVLRHDRPIRCDPEHCSANPTQPQAPRAQVEPCRGLTCHEQCEVDQEGVGEHAEQATLSAAEMLLSERRLYLCFTPGLCHHDPWETLAAALAAGVDIVQWRVNGPPDHGEDGDGFERCRTMCRDAHVPLIVNDDVMLAVRTGVAGAHIGQGDIPAHAARKLLGKGLLGVSTHDSKQIGAAIAAGADYLGFGPCFATETKGYDKGQETDAIVEAIEAAGSLPLFAIGGINAENLALLHGLGIDRIAVSSAILASEDPAAATSALRRIL